MEKSIITPYHFQLPKLTEKTLLFFNLEHFFLFHKIAQGTKIKSFGPSRRFSFKKEDNSYSALGGLIGAPLAVMTVENAVSAGSRFFISFGTAGLLGNKTDLRIGSLVTIKSGYDFTGISQDYDGDDRKVDFTPLENLSLVSGLASINSFYRLTEKQIRKFKTLGINLLDMETAPINQVLKKHNCSFNPLFVISDQILENISWVNGRNNPQFTRGIIDALNFLYNSLWNFLKK